MRRSITIITAAAAIATLAACANDPTTGAPALTPTGKTVATVGCAIDGIAQPIGLQFVSGIPTVGGIAATVDQAIVHPLVQKACGDLAASIGTSPAAAKPVVMPDPPAATTS